MLDSGLNNAPAQEICEYISYAGSILGVRNYVHVYTTVVTAINSSSHCTHTGGRCPCVVLVLNSQHHVEGGVGEADPHVGNGVILWK